MILCPCGKSSIISYIILQQSQITKCAADSLMRIHSDDESSNLARAEVGARGTGLNQLKYCFGKDPACPRHLSLPASELDGTQQLNIFCERRLCIVHRCKHLA
jgi:hypothetical protein